MCYSNHRKLQNSIWFFAHFLFLLLNLNEDLNHWFKSINSATHLVHSSEILFKWIISEYILWTVRPNWKNKFVMHSECIPVQDIDQYYCLPLAFTSMHSYCLPNVCAFFKLFLMYTHCLPNHCSFCKFHCPVCCTVLLCALVNYLVNRSAYDETTCCVMFRNITWKLWGGFLLYFLVSEQLYPAFAFKEIVKNVCSLENCTWLCATYNA